MEMSHSGLVRLPAKEVGVEAPREFESPHLRQSEEPRCAAVCRGFVVGVACWRGTAVPASRNASGLHEPAAAAMPRRPSPTNQARSARSPLADRGACVSPRADPG